MEYNDLFLLFHSHCTNIICIPSKILKEKYIWIVDHFKGLIRERMRW